MSRPEGRVLVCTVQRANSPSGKPQTANHSLCLRNFPYLVHHPHISNIALAPFIVEPHLGTISSQDLEPARSPIMLSVYTRFFDRSRGFRTTITHYHSPQFVVVTWIVGSKDSMGIPGTPYCFLRTCGPVTFVALRLIPASQIPKPPSIFP